MLNLASSRASLAPRAVALFASLTLAWALIGCDQKADGTKSSGGKASSSAADSAATISTAPLPEGAKPRVAHEMNPKDVCLAAPPPSATDSGLVTADELLWPNGSTIKIWFMDGSAEQIDLVVNEASEWMKYANLKFVWYTDPSSKPASVDTIVTFNKCEGGVQAWYVKGAGPSSKRHADKGDYSICLSAYEPEWKAGLEDHVRASVKHEFGHLIGLMHEQFNPDLKVTWDKPYVYDWCKRTQNWGQDMCDAQVMATLEMVNPNVRWKTTKFDKDSIMFYGIKDPNFTTERITYPQPLKISEIDKGGVAQLYPGADPSKFEIVKCKSDDASCGSGAPAPQPQTDGGFKLVSASKKLSEESGNVVWVVAVGLEGDMSKVQSVHYAFPREVAQGLVEGDKTQDGHPVGGKVTLASNITGFKYRARIDLKDNTTAVAEGELKLGDAAAPKPAPAPDSPAEAGGDLLDGWE